MNALIAIAALLGFFALGGLTDILQQKRRDWVVIALDIVLWACFVYVLYLIIGA